MIDRIEALLYGWLRALPSSVIGEAVAIEGQLFRPTAGRGFTAARLTFRREDLGTGQNRGHIWYGQLICDRVSSAQAGMPKARAAAVLLMNAWPSTGVFTDAGGLSVITQSADMQPSYAESEWAHCPVVFPWLSEEPAS
jgi:hypothetical protein